MCVKAFGVPVLASFLLHLELQAQPISWRNNLPEAMKEAEELDRPILIHFSVPGSDTDRKYATMFASRVFQAEMVNGYVPVQLDLNSHGSIASQMGVFRAGPLLLYSSRGKGLAVFSDKFNAPDLVPQMRTILSKAVEGLISSSETATGPVLPSIPKGQVLKGPIRKLATDLTPLDLHVLEKGKRYVLVVENTFSIWGGRPDASDAFYHYRHPTNPGTLLTHTYIRLRSPYVSLFGLMKKENGSPPIYNPQHVYEVPLVGEGRLLSLYFHEKDGRAYSDNSGELKFTLCEAKE
jgi:hypothetical protein